MSFKIGNLTVLVAEPDRCCAFCHAFTECRPYGPKGEQICFDCAMKDEATTKRMMRKHLYGEGSA